jgi:mannosyltransferase
MILIDGIIFSLQKHGGISVYFRALIEYLSKKEEKTVLILDELQNQIVSIDEKLTLIHHQKSRIFERYRVCRTPAQGKLFHSSYYRQPDNTSIPSVVTVHDFIYERYQRGPRQWVHTSQKKAAIRAAQAVICISESTRQDFLEFVGETPGQKIHVIHNGVDDIFSRLSLEHKGTSFVLFVGQRAGYKNFSLVLAAMAFLPELELHCVGGGQFRPEELNDVPASVALRVRHLGFVSDRELNVLYNSAICLVYPSSYEGFGIPVVEAMRAGCPVVSMDCKAVLEVGRDALTVVSELDPKATADAILKTSSSERASLIQRGLVVAQGYSWDITHSQTLEVYRSLGA